MKTASGNDDDKDYEVGYGKPPKHSRFPKGKSGNPTGRPKKLKSVDDLFADALAKDVIINGKKITKQELIVEAVIQHAAKGKPAAMKIVMEQLAAANVRGQEEFDPAIADRNALAKWIAILETPKSKNDVS